MCFDPAAMPPPSPSGREPITGDTVTLTSADGTDFLAYHVKAEEPNGRAVVVLPDVRGLFPFYKALAGAFAAEGFESIAIDYFGRTAKDDYRGEDFDLWPQVEALDVSKVQADVAAAKDALESTQVYAVGFCLGGGHAFTLAGSGLGFAGVVGFYGQPRAERQWYPIAMDVVDRMDCPVLGLFGGADESIPPEAIAEFEAALTRAGVAHSLHTYPGAPHSFFDRSSAQWESQCTDAWQRTLAFMRS